MARLERPGDERTESAGLILQTSYFFHMLDALSHCLTKADDHRGRAFHPDGMRACHDMEPVTRHDLLGADTTADFIDEDFRAAARQAVKSGFLQVLECIENRKTCLTGKMLDFRSRKGMDRDTWEFLLDAAQHPFVIFKAKIRIQASLDHDLRTTSATVSRTLSRISS